MWNKTTKKSEILNGNQYWILGDEHIFHNFRSDHILLYWHLIKNKNSFFLFFWRKSLIEFYVLGRSDSIMIRKIKYSGPLFPGEKKGRKESNVAIDNNDRKSDYHSHLWQSISCANSIWTETISKWV